MLVHVNVTYLGLRLLLRLGGVKLFEHEFQFFVLLEVGLELRVSDGLDNAGRFGRLLLLHEVVKESSGVDVRLHFFHAQLGLVLVLLSFHGSLVGKMDEFEFIIILIT